MYEKYGLSYRADEDKLYYKDQIVRYFIDTYNNGQGVLNMWGSNISSDEVFTRTFTLCGFGEGNTSSYASMAFVSEDFALEQYQAVDPNASGNLCGIRMLQVNLKSDKDIAGTMDQILSDTGLSDLDYGINLAYLSDTKTAALQETIPMYIGMLLVFVAGYLIIYNIFQISVATDIQFYGRLKTIGASTKQIKKLIYKQAIKLALLGIPIGLLIGYLLGVVLVPMLISYDQVSISANPLIFIGSAIFTFFTILISCLRPAKIAGKVSPMEALRYNDSQTSGKRKSKKSKNGASISRMAWSNLGRNKKRTVLVVSSLMLGLVLLSAFYAKNASFDMEKYLSDLTIADFSIADATSDDFMNGYNPKGTTIQPALVEQIATLDGLETMGRLYSQETTINLSEHALENIRSYFEKNDRLAQMKNDEKWTQEYLEATSTSKAGAVIFGADEFVYQNLADARYLIDGEWNAQQFATGMPCAYTIGWMFVLS